MSYPVVIENCTSRRAAWTLCVTYKLRPQKDGSYKGTVTDSQYRKLSSFCKERKMRFRIEDEFGERGSEYRQIFFKNNKPALFGRYYYCAYCGKLLPKQKLTVDHIIPVGVANKDLKVRKRMKLFGYKSVNDPRNLVASCMTCNTKKGTKTGFGWKIRGTLGRLPIVWHIRHLARISFVIWLFWILFLH